MSNSPRWPGAGPGFFPRSIGDTSPPPVITGISPNTASIAGGDTITITGTNFSNQSDGSAPIVTFDGVAATGVVVVNSTTITAVAPAAIDSGVVDVTVTVGSQVATATNAAAYYEGEVVSVSPNYGPVAGGTSIVIYGNNFVAGSTISMNGAACTGVTFVDSHHFFAVTPASINPGDKAVHVDIDIFPPAAAAFKGRNLFKYNSLARGSDIRYMPGMIIRKQLGNRPNTARWRISGDGQPPKAGESITLMDGATQLFKGSIQRTNLIYEGTTSNIAWDVEAVDFSFILNKYCPYGVYTDVSATDIVIDLMMRFAPSFGVAFVQTDLPKISISFGGAKDFSTCLTDICTAMGAGHWYLDDTPDLHFFRTPLQLSLPTNQLIVGPASAMTVAETGTRIPNIIQSSLWGWWTFTVSFVYDDGTESAIGSFSDVAAMQGTFTVSWSNIPIGPAVGSKTCVKRRVYLRAWTNNTYLDLNRAFEIQDNSSTSFTSDNQYGENASISVVRSDWELPIISESAIPMGPPGQVTARESSIVHTYPSYPFGNSSSGTYGFTPGDWVFRVACLYRDGTLSAGSIVSGSVYLDGLHAVDFSNVPIGQSVNGVAVIARVIFGKLDGDGTSADWQTGRAFCWGVVPDNSTTSATIGPSYHSLALPLGGGVDGPSLEDFSPPDDIDATNSNLLYEPPLSMSIDGTQVRNRIRVMGVGSSTTDTHSYPYQNGTQTITAIGTLAGVTIIGVADTSVFPARRAKVLDTNSGEVYDYTGRSVPSGNGSIYLSPSTPVLFFIPNGTEIRNFLQVDDLDSQSLLSQVEVDADGNRTDGVHEYAIDDSNLVTPVQLQVRGEGELLQFASPIITITYVTRDPKSRPGALVTVALADPPVSGTFLIQEVTVDQVQQYKAGGSFITPRYTVQASSVKYDLTDLLLEIVANTPSKTYLKGVVASAVAQAVAEIPPATPSILLSVSVTLTTSQIQSLKTTPVVIVQPCDSAHINYALFWELISDIQVGFSSNPTFSLVYVSHTGQTTVNSSSMSINSVGNRWMTLPDVSMNATTIDLSGAGLEIQASADVTGGGGSIKVIVYYILIPSTAP